MAGSAAGLKAKNGTKIGAVAGPRRKSPARPHLSERMRDAVAIASEKGLLDGGRTVMLRGRMPAELVKTAKLKTGIESDSKLIEAALANLAVEEDYWDWFISQRGTAPACPQGSRACLPAR